MPGMSCSQNGSPLQFCYFYLKIILNAKINKRWHIIFAFDRPVYHILNLEITVEGELPVCPFTLNKGPNSKASIEALCLDFLHEPY
jgi:hypothetical protein